MLLSNEQNRLEYWRREPDLYLNKLMELGAKINDDVILKFLADCSITQRQQLEDFISTL